MAFKLNSPTTKRNIIVIAMAILAAYNITSPIDLKGYLPAWISSPTVGGFSLINIAAYVVLIGAWLVWDKQTA